MAPRPSVGAQLVHFQSHYSILFCITHFQSQCKAANRFMIRCDDDDIPWVNFRWFVILTCNAVVTWYKSGTVDTTWGGLVNLTRYGHAYLRALYTGVTGLQKGIRSVYHQLRGHQLRLLIDTELTRRFWIHWLARKKTCYNAMYEREHCTLYKYVCVCVCEYVLLHVCMHACVRA